MKNILITGGGSGLGAELAKVYGIEGNNIILVGRNIGKLHRVSEELKNLNVSSDIIGCDISNRESVYNLVKEISNKYDTIDYLINNAGVGYFGPLEELSLDNLDKIIDINVKGNIMITQGLLPYVRERILNIISTAGLKGKKNESIYVASKFAVRGFTESLQKELEHKDLKVTAVYMGGMDTPFWHNKDHIKDKSRLKSPAKVAEEIKSMDDGRKEIIISK